MPRWASCGLFALLLALEEGKDWGWTSYRILILFTIGLICFAGAFFALFLRSGKPASGAGPAVAH